MKDPGTSSKASQVLAALTLVLVLAVMLGFRVLAGSGRETDIPKVATFAPVVRLSGPVPTVPDPNPLLIGSLEMPCWSCNENKGWPVEFRTDLDMLAPLGKRDRNAGEWFKDFTKPTGARYSEGVAAMKRRSQHPSGVGLVLPPADPLLIEAEPWCDMATMHYYPDIFPLEGYATRIPNLLIQLAFARSWVARGYDAPVPSDAMADFRRAIRLGRLLRQENAVIISDLVGLECIRLGAKGIYDTARRHGDLELALAASVVLGEVAPQKLRTSERVTTTDLSEFLHISDDSHVAIVLPEKRFVHILETANQDPDTRFRAEAIIGLGLVYRFGPAAQQDQARSALDTLASDSDIRIANTARWSLDGPPLTAKELEELFD